MATAKAADKDAGEVFAGFIDSLVGNQTISMEAGALIKAAIDHRRAELTAALAVEVAAPAKPKAKE